MVKAVADLYTLFDNFVAATGFKQILQSFHLICTALDLDPTDSPVIYDSLRSNIKDWRAQKLWLLLDKKYEEAVYMRQRATDKLGVLVIGAGPCGLRAAIECALLGSRVVVVEHRDKFSRNNVLHLWEFVIQDLKSIGAKIFYPKFCTGSIEHISIRQLQCILLKVALCYGVQIFEGVTYKDIRVPSLRPDGSYSGFRAYYEPSGHLLDDYEFDVLIGADGKRNTVNGFPREEMRGKVAIGITANFVNRKTHAEERVPEISGIAYIFNQTFFKEMNATTGVDLENIVYYKDETHYFVMCAKKQSLLESGVILKDSDDVAKLLSPENVDQDMLCKYASSAADFATKGQLPNLDFAVNHKGQPDIAMFDFTSLFSSKCSVRLMERHGRYLMLGIVGDSLHEPFWPTGSGIARGFLGVMDTAWLIRGFGLQKSGPLQLIAERESIYRLLAQVTNYNLHKQSTKFTIDPKTRYVSLEYSMRPEDVKDIVDTDNQRIVDITEPILINRPNCVHDDPHRLEYAIWRFCYIALAPFKLKFTNMDSSWADGLALAALVGKFKPACLDYFAVRARSEDPVVRTEYVFKRVHEVLEIPPPCDAADWKDLKKADKMVFISKLIASIRADIGNVQSVLLTPRSAASKRPKALPARFDTSKAKKSSVIENFQVQIREKCGVVVPAPFVPTYKREEAECAKQISLAEPSEERYVTKRPQVSPLDPALVDNVKRFFDQEDTSPGSTTPHLRRLRPEEGKDDDGSLKLRRNIRSKEADDVILRAEQLVRRKELAGLNTVTRRKTQQIIYPSPEVPLPQPSTVTTIKQDGSVVLRPVAPVQPKRQVVSMPTVDSLYDSVNPRQTNCQLCSKVVYLAERLHVESMYVHRGCFKCAYCGQPLRVGECGQDRELESHYRNKFFCRAHLRLSLREKIAKIERNEKRALDKRASQDEGSASDSSKENVEQAPTTGPETAPDSPPMPSLANVTIRVPSRPPETRTTSVLNFYAQRAGESDFEPMDSSALARRLLASPSDPANLNSTPERAAFDAQEAPRKVKQAVVLNDSDTDDEYTTGSSSGSSSRGRVNTLISETSIESPVRSRSSTKHSELDLAFIDDDGDRGALDESLSDDGLDEDDQEVLERTLLDAECDPKVTLATKFTAEVLLERINDSRRQSVRPGIGPSYFPSNAAQSHNEEYGTPTSTLNTPVPYLEQMLADARIRARGMSDEQLGLNNSTPHRGRTRSPNGRERAVTTGQLTHDPEIRRHAFSTARADTAPPADEPPPLPAADPPQEHAYYGFPSPRMSSRFFNISPTELHSESQKEKELRSRHTWDRIKNQRGSRSPLGISTPSSSPLPTVAVNTAVIPPSPRPPLEKTTIYVPAVPSRAPTRTDSPVAKDPNVPLLAPNDRNLRSVQKRVEKYKQHLHDERGRSAQEIQRQLEETEVRLENISKRGQMLETTLKTDPTNISLLAEWRALTQERQILEGREKDLRLRVREVILDERYSALRTLVAEKNTPENDATEVRERLEEMLKVIDEKKLVKQQLDQANEEWCERRKAPNRDSATRTAVDFRECLPVFLPSCV
ncbi:unnamed protein product, partial [Mesorhabditis spiculigera]